MSRRPLALALCCACIASHAFAAEPALDNIRWSAPWKAGMSLEYATSALTEETAGGTTARELATDIEIVAIAEATDQGFLQTWRSKPGAFRVVEMAPGQRAMYEAMVAAMADDAVEVELAKTGTAKGVRNTRDLAAKMREVLRPIFEAQIEAQVATLEPAKQADARTAAQANVARALDTMFSPEMMGAMLSRLPMAYNAFFGLDVEADAEYESTFETPTPFGGAALAMKTRFSASVSEDDPDDVFVSYETQPDQARLVDFAKHIGEKLSGGQAWSEADLKKFASFNVHDEGMFLVHRPTGVIEMFESTRTTTTDGKTKVERKRMRQLGGAHDHVWTDEAE